MGARYALRGRVRRWWKPALAALSLLGVLYATRLYWLRQAGEFLVRGEPPQKAEVAVVLAGDWFGHRIMKALELTRQGYASRVLVDSPRGPYDTTEAELAIGFAVRRGASRELLEPLPMQTRSTMAEAQVVDQELRRRNLTRALIVTSNYHTRRTRSIFRYFGSPEVQYTVVAAPDEDFSPDAWWRTRDGQKIVFLEYVKLLNWWLVD